MKTKKVVLRKKFRQKHVVISKQNDTDLTEICNRLDSVIKRSKRIEDRLNEIEEKRKGAFPNSSFVQNSISSYSRSATETPKYSSAVSKTTQKTNESTFSTPTTIRFNSSPIRTTEIDASTIHDSMEIQNSKYTSPYEKRKVKFAKTPTMKQILIELNELKKDVKAVFEVQNDLIKDIEKIKEYDNENDLYE